MIKFRLVELDPDGYIKKEFYNSPSFPGDENSRKFKDAVDDCIFEYGYKLKFFNKKLRPQSAEIHINKDNKIEVFLNDEPLEVESIRVYGDSEIKFQI